MGGDGSRVALASFVAGSLLAGGNAVGVRFSNRELAPLWGAGLRFTLAAALLVAVMAVCLFPHCWPCWAVHSASRRRLCWCGGSRASTRSR